MTPTDHARRRLLRSGLLAAPLAPAWLAGCATRPVGEAIAGPTQAPRPPTPRVSQRWRYRLINRFNERPITEVTATCVEVMPQVRIELVRADGKPIFDEVYTRAWQVVQEPFYGTPLVFDEPMPLLPDPIAVGADMYRDTRYRVRGYENRFQWRLWMAAPRWERIVVPAGAFDCLRIERMVRFEYWLPFRLSSRREETLWYAPAVERWVRRDWAGYYLDPSPPDPSDRPGRAFRAAPMRVALIDEREDSIRWELTEHVAAPVA